MPITPRKKVLDNGVRIITVPMRDNPAVTVMALATVGSNNDPKNQEGIAHFLEHMLMKGGEKYDTPYAVSSTLDAIGATSNAMTGEEFTGYYAKGHPTKFDTMIDVIADLYQRPRIDSNEIEKERGVIREEINLYEDIPMHRASGLLDEVMYGDQPAGIHTLGLKKTTGKITRDDFVSFRDTHYTGKNTVVIVTGGLDRTAVNKRVAELFGDMPSGRVARRSAPKELQKSPQIKIEKRETDQVHFRIGCRAYKAGDKRQSALQVLNAVLGGGMSSRLFQLLREEMGVCYYVGSGVAEHDTYGSLVIRAGVDTGRLTEVIENIMTELARLRDEKVENTELKKAKDYLIGSMSLSLEGSEGVSDFYLEQLVLEGEMKTANQLAKDIRAVTAEDVQKVARDVFQNKKLNLAAVGNVKNKANIKKKLTL